MLYESRDGTQGASSNEMKEYHEMARYQLPIKKKKTLTKRMSRLHNLVIKNYTPSDGNFPKLVLFYTPTMTGLYYLTNKHNC